MSEISLDKARIEIKLKHSYQDVLNEINLDYEHFKLKKLYELKVERDNILFQNPLRRKHEHLIAQELKYKMINIDSQIERLKKNSLKLEDETLFFQKPIQKYNRISPKYSISQFNSNSYVKTNEDIEIVENVSDSMNPVDNMHLKSSFKSLHIQTKELVNPVDYVPKIITSSSQIFNSSRVNIEKSRFQKISEGISPVKSIELKNKPTTSYLDEFLIN